MPSLQITLPDGTELSHELTESLVTVGRLPDNTIEIGDVSVSSHHAQLLGSSSDYILKDIGSTNGTRLNGKSIAADEERPLQNGDAIVFGNVEALYASEHIAAERPMPEAEELAAVAAESSVRPADFANASPFASRKKKKDPAATGILVFGAVSILAFIGGGRERLFNEVAAIRSAGLPPFLSNFSADQAAGDLATDFTDDCDIHVSEIRVSSVSIRGLLLLLVRLRRGSF